MARRRCLSSFLKDVYLCLNPLYPLLEKVEQKVGPKVEQKVEQKVERLASLANVFKNLQFPLRADYFHFSLEICISSSGVTPSA